MSAAHTTDMAPDGSERISGHSLRVTGAQGLAGRGWNLWTVQLLGRWGSDSVKGYFREAPLQALLHSRPTEQLDIDTVVEQLVAKLASTHLAHLPAPAAPELEDANVLVQERVEQQNLPPEVTLVINDISGVTHRMATEKLACCGWAYHRHPHTIVGGPVASHHIPCSNCFPQSCE